MQIYITITTTIQIHTCPITTKVDFSTNQKMPKTASKPPEARRQAWNRASLPALEENHSCRYLDLGLLASRTETTHFSVLGTMSYVWEHGKNWKLEPAATFGPEQYFWVVGSMLEGTPVTMIYHFCCWSHPACGALQPSQMNTVGFIELYL